MERFSSFSELTSFSTPKALIDFAANRANSFKKSWIYQIDETYASLQVILVASLEYDSPEVLLVESIARI